MKKIIRTFVSNDSNKSTRQFECHISDVMGDGAIIEVSIREVRNPSLRKWWQFRTRYFGTKYFWVDDYPTIKDGIDSCLAKLMEEEEKGNLRRKKFEEFEKNA